VKTVLTEIGPVPLDVPRDRKGESGPLIVAEARPQGRGFGEAIVSLYARGLTTGEIRGHLGEIYAPASRT
jgi:putative transposase